MGCKISRIAFHLPQNSITNDELHANFPCWNRDKFQNRFGIYNRFFVDEHETSLDLAFQCATKNFSKEELFSIDFIIFCTQTPDHLLPGNSHILHEKIGFSPNTGSIDINLGCSGFVYSLGIAKGLIETGSASRIAIVTSETYSKIIDRTDINNLAIFGDAAAITIVERSDVNCLGNFVFKSDGNGWKHLVSHSGGFRKSNLDNQNASSSSITSKFHMDGPKIFKLVMENVPKIFYETLDKNSLKKSDVDYFVFHQANKHILEQLSQKLDIEPSRFCIHLNDFGNTVSCSIPIALCDLLQAGIIKKGYKIMILGFGVGFSYAASIVQV